MTLKITDRFARPSTRVPLHPTNEIDGTHIAETIQRALAAAGLDTTSGPLKNASDTIWRALAAAGLTPRLRQVENPPIDAVADNGTDDRVAQRASALPKPRLVPPRAPEREPSTAPNRDTTPGTFVSGTFSNVAGTRTYRLYVPTSHVRETELRAPLVVMLHGCTQSPEDFAAGTRMNALAEEHGFLVLYPAQAANANGSRCWNWFRAEDQRRDTGEPALIAGLVHEIASTYPIDARRIFVAGLSAGAAMAVILGTTYPELFAAVGAHSGLPYGAAQDMPSAFGAMHGAEGSLAPRGLRGITIPGTNAEAPAVPTIVFHGDADQTVTASNGARIVEDATSASGAGVHVTASFDRDQASRAYTRTVYTDESNRPVVEHWVLHGAGHAWSGGSVSGSFTDGSGPDASAEMIRFFFAQQRGGTA